MRRIVSTATLSVFLFLAGVATTTATTIHADTVSATADSSGVSITINQSSTSLNGETSGIVSITVSSSSTDQTLVCVLDPEAAEVNARRTGEIDVTWSSEEGANIVFTAPSIRIAGMLSNFSCEPAS